MADIMHPAHVRFIGFDPMPMMIYRIAGVYIAIYRAARLIAYGRTHAEAIRNLIAKINK
jgi:hypothetical protein